MKNIIYLFTFFLFVACSQGADFTSADGSNLKSLMNGETVEVIPDDLLDVEADTNDDGVVGNEGSNGEEDSDDRGEYVCEGCNNGGKDGGKGGSTTRDGGKGGGKKETTSRDREEYICEGCNNDNGEKERNKTPCRDKNKNKDKQDDSVEIDENNDAMTTSLDRINKYKDLKNSVSCDESGKKISICHYPAGKAESRKTLCVGAAAVKGLIKSSSANFLGSCPAGDESEETE